MKVLMREERLETSVLVSVPPMKATEKLIGGTTGIGRPAAVVATKNSLGDVIDARCFRRSGCRSRAIVERRVINPLGRSISLWSVFMSCPFRVPIRRRALRRSRLVQSRV